MLLLIAMITITKEIKLTLLNLSIIIFKCFCFLSHWRGHVKLR